MTRSISLLVLVLIVVAVYAGRGSLGDARRKQYGPKREDHYSGQQSVPIEPNETQDSERVNIARRTKERGLANLDVMQANERYEQKLLQDDAGGSNPLGRGYKGGIHGMNKPNYNMKKHNDAQRWGRKFQKVHDANKGVAQQGIYSTSKHNSFYSVFAGDNNAARFNAEHQASRFHEKAQKYKQKAKAVPDQKQNYVCHNTIH
jgi:hypothetical protein